MSPNSYVAWCDESNLLCGYDGESSEPVLKWTYSEFEYYNGEAVTPSMYEFLAGYVMNNITKEQLYEIQGGDYCSGDLEEEAVNVYYDLPILDRIELHNQMMTNLKNESKRYEDKMNAFIDAVLDEDCPFDPTSPIYTDYNAWLRSQKIKWEKKWEDVQNQLCEESFWSSGAEDGAGDMSPMYDPTGEL
jgi:hypothetical protein